MPKFKITNKPSGEMLEYIKSVVGCDANASYEQVAKALESSDKRNKVARFVGNEPLRKGWYILTFKCGYKSINGGSPYPFYELQPIVSKDDTTPNGKPIDVSAMSLMGQRNIDNVVISGTYNDQYYDSNAKEQKNDPFTCTANDFDRTKYVDVCKELGIEENLLAFDCAIQSAKTEGYTVLVEYHGDGCKVSTAKKDRKHINGGTVYKGYQSVFRVRVFTLHFVATKANTGAN